jgi:hypothetical protein
MQYAVDTINIEISRLNKAIRKLNDTVVIEGENDLIQSRIAEFELQIRELKKAIGVLKEYARANTANRYATGNSQFGVGGNSYGNQSTYTSRLIDSNNQ